MAERFDDALLEQIRAALPPSVVIGRAVPLKRAGRILKGLCPLHGERTPSFTVDDARGTWKCFGCGAGGNIFRWLMAREGLGFPQAVERLAGECGVSLPDRPAARRLMPAPVPPAAPLPREATAEERDSIARRREAARRIWTAAAPIAADGVAAAYLRRRHLWPLLPGEADVLREGLVRHPETREHHPALVARIDAPGGQPAGVHRIYLMPDGRKLVGVGAAKLALGPIEAASVRLAPVAQHLGYAEGIETAMAARRLSGLSCWACITGGELARQRPPMDVLAATIFADRDTPKPQHGLPEGAGMKYARALAAALAKQGVQAAIRLPNPPHGDYADVLAAHALLGLA